MSFKPLDIKPETATTVDLVGIGDKLVWEGEKVRLILRRDILSETPFGYKLKEGVVYAGIAYSTAKEGEKVLFHKE